MNILDLNGENALISGAGQGVGRQIALHFAAHNAGTVYVNDFSAERAQAVVAEIRASGARAEAIACDVTDFARLQSAIEPLDIHLLVNGLAQDSGSAAGAGRGWSTHTFHGVEIGRGDEIAVEIAGGPLRLDYVQLNSR